MIKSLTDIRNITVIDQNQSNNLYSIAEISFDENEIGSGGFGSVHKVYSIDGLNKNTYVLKIFTNDEKKEHAYEVIELLHTKLKTRQATTGLPIYHEFPELLGLPFMAFHGYDKITDKECTGFLMYDLSAIGYDFFGSDNIKTSEYQNLEIENKFYLSYQLAKVIDFLHEINFIHSDINEQSIFINPQTIRLAIIDFDSGYHFDSQDKPSTIGKMSHWISGKFRNIIGNNKSSSLTLEDRIREENWLLANGLFEVLFGVMPYFFLNDADDSTKKEYLRNNKWPLVDYPSSAINLSSLPILRNLKQILENFKVSGAEKLVESFEKVFNEGYTKEKERLSAKEWKSILYHINVELENSPKLQRFTSSNYIITRKNESVKFHWEAFHYSLIFLDGKICDISESSRSLNLIDASEIFLTVKNDFGEVSESIKIEANKVAPEILTFETSTVTREDLSPVELSWKTKNTSKVVISNLKDSFRSNGSTEISPTEKTVYVLKAIGHFDQEVERQIEINVIHPKILKFYYEINLNEGIDNIDLYWETEDAINLEISPKVGAVSSSGVSHVKIRKETPFTLKAEGHFGKAEKTIDTFPFPAPIIEHILVETPKIELQSKITKDFVTYPFEDLKITNIEYSNIIQFEKENLDHKTLTNQLTPPSFEHHNALLQKEIKDYLSFTDIYQQLKGKIYSMLK
jgi:serine/threonine protein kinase